MTLDPNLAAILTSLLIAGGTWLYHKAKGDKVDTLSDTIGGVVNSGIHLAVVEAESHPDEIRATVSNYVWMTLAKLKIPRNATSEALVNAAIETAISDAIQAAKDRDNTIDAAITAAQADVAKAQAMAVQGAKDAAAIVPTISYRELKPGETFTTTVETK